MATTSGKRARRQSQEAQYQPQQFKPIKPLNWAQETYLEAIQTSEVIFGIGSAGTGKTYIAANYAAEQLYNRNIERIILTRPNIETGRGLGFLPGELEEKYAPFLEPFENTLKKALGSGFYEYCLKNSSIDPRPVGFMRGATFENSVVLIDECQNLTRTEFKMILSRIGRNCKVILSGDPDQSDIPDSGLQDAVTRLEGLPGIEVVRFLDYDIVRSKMCKQIILAYKH